MDEANIQIKMQSDLVKAALVLELAAATPKRTGFTASRWRVEGDKIVNDGPAIEYLNEGSSKQAPAHFIEATLLNNPGVTPSGNIIRSS